MDRNHCTTRKGQSHTNQTKATTILWQPSRVHACKPKYTEYSFDSLPQLLLYDQNNDKENQELGDFCIDEEKRRMAQILGQFNNTMHTYTVRCAHTPTHMNYMYTHSYTHAYTHSKYTRMHTQCTHTLMHADAHAIAMHTHTHMHTHIHMHSDT